MNKIILAFLVACNVATMVNCHGTMIDPVSRMSGIYLKKYSILFKLLLFSK